MGTPDLSLAAGRIRESGLALLGMIDTVLDHASLEAGALPMQIEPVVLAGVVDEVCTVARPRIRHRGSSLSVDAVADALVLADRTRLKQLLLALVSQANSSGGDRLTILLFVRPPADGWVEVQVRDNGPGLSADELQRALAPFHNTHGRIAPAAGDVGLDLALARGLCEGMGGRFVAESEPGRGSRFSVFLSLASPTHPSLEPVHGQDPAGRGQRVNRDMLSRRLVRQGLRVLMAVDGGQGLDAAAGGPGPGPDGHEPARHRRLGGDTPPEGRRSARHTGHRADRARDGGRPRARRSRPAATTSTPSRSSSPRLLAKIDALVNR